MTTSHIGFICPASVPALIGRKAALPLEKADYLPWFDRLKANLSGLLAVAVQDADTYKRLAGKSKIGHTAGVLVPCKFAPDVMVAYIPPNQAILLNPETKAQTQATLEALRALLRGEYVNPGAIHPVEVETPQTPAQIETALFHLSGANPLSVDIETRGIKHTETGIETISFSCNDSSAVAFAVDKDRSPEEAAEVRRILRNFLEEYTGKLIAHKATFEITHLIAALWGTDQEAIWDGILNLVPRIECTHIMAYTLMNSCAQVDLSLKGLVLSEYGDYGIDVTDTTKVPVEDLIEYNGKDTAATFWLYNKLLPQVEEGTWSTYVFLRSLIREIVLMQLNGVPVNVTKAIENTQRLQTKQQELVDNIRRHPAVERLMWLMAEEWAVDKNSKLKKKRVTAFDFKEKFNPDSPKQMQRLLYEMLEFPVLHTTDTGQPSTNKDTIAGLIAQGREVQLLSWIQELSQISTLLTTFLPHFVNAVDSVLYGCFNIGGTQSGRLSSDNPNLTNLPSHGNEYAKYVKELVEAPEGWLMVGVDFAALEDRALTLLTKDPNLLRVYVDGFDGHCLRSYSYFRNKMPDIEFTKESINSIAKRYPDLRQLSKSPSFALFYQGTIGTLMQKFGFSREQATEIFEGFWDLYKEYGADIQRRTDEAARRGYATLAFGLRLQVPLLHRSALGHSRISQAAAEQRSVANAFGQSYGLLNSRSAHAFLDRVLEAGLQYDIRPIMQIHDAQYYLVRRDASLLKWVNDNLIPEIQWNELPELQHPVVGFEGNLALYWPNWGTEHKIPNDAPIEFMENLLERCH